MADDLVERREALRSTLERTKGQGTEAQTDAVAALMLQPSQGTANTIWIILITGLLILIGGALAGLIFADKDDPLLTVVTTLAAGLLGLFVKSPLEGAADGQ
jgi:hypothetical protein